MAHIQSGSVCHKDFALAIDPALLNIIINPEGDQIEIHSVHGVYRWICYLHNRWELRVFKRLASVFKITMKIRKIITKWCGKTETNEITLHRNHWALSRPGNNWLGNYSRRNGGREGGIANCSWL